MSCWVNYINSDHIRSFNLLRNHMSQSRILLRNFSDQTDKHVLRKSVFLSALTLGNVPPKFESNCNIELSKQSNYKITFLPKGGKKTGLLSNFCFLKLMQGI